MSKIPLEQVAEDISCVASKKTQNENFGSIILTIMIVGIIVNLIRVTQECNKNKVRDLEQKAKDKYNFVIREYPNDTASSLALQLLKNME